MASFHSADRGPFVPAYRPDAPLRVLMVGLEAHECERVQGWLRLPHIVLRTCIAETASAQARALGPNVLIVEAREELRTQVLQRLLDECRSAEPGVLLLLEPHDAAPAIAAARPLFLRRPFNRARLVAAVEQAAMPWQASAAAQWHERQQREEVETLLDLALDLTSQLELPELLQHLADAARHLTGAAYAALFRHGGGEGRPCTLAALSGAPRAAFEGFGMPGETSLLAPTFAGERITRCDDVHVHPRYGRDEPHHGLPPGHLPVRSYLGVPVVSREGQIFGALLLGHGEPRVFTRRSERLAEAIAAQVATAIDHHRHSAGSEATAATQATGPGARDELARFGLDAPVQAPAPAPAPPMGAGGRSLSGGPGRDAPRPAPY